MYIVSEDGSATVKGHTASLPNELVIPSTITKDGVNYRVTNIFSEAFSNCTNLISVIIPDGVTKIGKSAFDGCTNLTSVNISDAVTSIGQRSFYKCEGLTSVTIPESVTTIGDEAFSTWIISDVYCHADPEKLTLSGWASSNWQIHVPTIYLDKWKDKYGKYYTFIGDIKNITDESITIPSQTYTGSALTPVVKDSDKTLVEGEDYTITLPQSGCTNAGEYIATLKGKKLYYKKAKKNFTINPAPVTVTAENKTRAFGESDPEFTALR